jgi:hypothetical protein
LAILLQEQEKNLTDIMTGDESWFFLQYRHDSAWAGCRDELPVRIKPEIDAEKCLIYVIWSGNGIYSLADVPKGESYDSAFFCDVVVPSLIDDIRSRSRPKSLKGSNVHLGNARPHNSHQFIDCFQATKARRMAQSAYSPGLTSSDLFLFGYLKQKLQVVNIPDRERLKGEIIRIRGGIGPDVLISVFEDWIKRLEWVDQNGGEYSHNETKKKRNRFMFDREKVIIRTC